MTRKPAILLVASTWWPLTARLAMAFMEHGCSVSAVCPPGHPLRTLPDLSALHPYPTLRPLRALRDALLRDRPDVVVPGDLRAVWQLHRCHALYPELRAVIERSLGDPWSYSVVRSRTALLETARELGMRTPAGSAVMDEADLTAWQDSQGFPAALKLDGTWGGEGVETVRSLPEAVAAFRRMRVRKGAATALKRTLVNSDPVALWCWRQGAKPEVSIQRWIEGRPATAMFAAWNGKVVGSVAAEVLATQHAKGAATIVLPIASASMESAGRLLAERLGMSGFFGLDFMVEKRTGEALLIEMNPRCTQLGHLRLSGKTDLAGALAAQVSGQAVPSATASLPEGPIAFFPQSLQRAAELEAVFAASYLDVPRGQPALVRDLEQEPWPERRWMPRLYDAVFGEKDAN